MLLMVLIGPGPALRPVPPPNLPQSFNMTELNKVFQLAEAIPPIARHVSSERPGGEA
jgi:hypothetical protein